MINAVVTDIEGTTSSISFVHQVLFPYARAHITEFVRSHYQQAEVKPLIDAIRQEIGQDADLTVVINQLIDWIDGDQKVTQLKALQGLIWETGYRQGDYLGHVYADAVTALKNWQQQGIALYVYSSGSVYAQKLLFAHTEFGDLTALFNDYFDTLIGNKKQPQSYRRIAETIHLPGEQIVFLSDLKDELDAAALAGMHTYWLVRETAAVDVNAAHKQVSTFAEIDLTTL